jgi:hypothetical protein
MKQRGSRFRRNQAMAARTDKDISGLIRERTPVDEALARGVRDALMRHVRAGVPAVEWRDGKSVWLSPEEISRRLEEMDKKR